MKLCSENKIQESLLQKLLFGKEIINLSNFHRSTFESLIEIYLGKNLASDCLEKKLSEPEKTNYIKEIMQLENFLRLGKIVKKQAIEILGTALIGAMLGNNQTKTIFTSQIKKQKLDILINSDFFNNTQQIFFDCPHLDLDIMN
jgi:hypothetical protein